MGSESSKTYLYDKRTIFHHQFKKKERDGVFNKPNRMHASLGQDLGPYYIVMSISVLLSLTLFCSLFIEIDCTPGMDAIGKPLPLIQPEAFVTVNHCKAMCPPCVGWRFCLPRDVF